MLYATELGRLISAELCNERLFVVRLRSRATMDRKRLELGQGKSVNNPVKKGSFGKLWGTRKSDLPANV